MADQRLTFLLDGFLAGDLAEQERLELFRLVEAIGDEEALTELEQAWYRYGRPAHLLAEERSTAIVREILGKETDVYHRSRGVRMIWIRRLAVAAVLLTVFSLAGYWLYRQHQPQKDIPAVAVKTNDVPAPVSSRATLRLADGRLIYLDSSANGIVASQGDARIVKSADGQIGYHVDGNAGRTMMYNTLTNPRGSKVIDMTLGDGSRVWLNAGSSVTFPVVFAGNDRQVSVTGEAYFEVAHDKTKPFLVAAGETITEVLGTHFNVNAYDDEEAVKVTLLEGSVNVKRRSVIVQLQPGEQALAGDPSIKTLHPHLEEVMAWKNGMFSFKNAGIRTIMRQVEKWYDVQVRYEGDSDETFHVEMSRNTAASSVFKILQETGKLKIAIEGKIVTVKL